MICIFASPHPILPIPVHISIYFENIYMDVCLLLHLKAFKN